MKKNRRTTTHIAATIQKPKLTPQEGIRAYQALKAQIEKEKILARDYWYYAILTAVLTLGMIGSLILVYQSHSPFAVLLWSMITGVFMVQFGGLMHDSGHRAVFSSAKNNDVFGLYTAIFTNLSYKNWRETHNKHHAHPNEEGEDPDLDIVFHNFSKEQYKRSSPVVKLLTKYQAYLFYPVRAMLFLTTRYDSYRYFLANSHKDDVPHIVFFTLGIVFWFVLPFLFFPLWKALLFILIENLTVGIYASNIFAPNHKGMPQVPKGMKLTYIEQQIETSRNIKPGFITDTIYMGLNYQIEHHLFPNCPRNKLHKITPYVKKLCRQYGLAYTVDTVLETQKAIVGNLSEMAEVAKENQRELD